MLERGVFHITRIRLFPSSKFSISYVINDPIASLLLISRIIKIARKIYGHNKLALNMIEVSYKLEGRAFIARAIDWKNNGRLKLVKNVCSVYERYFIRTRENATKSVVFSFRNDLISARKKQGRSSDPESISTLITWPIEKAASITEKRQALKRENRLEKKPTKREWLSTAGQIREPLVCCVQWKRIN